MRRFIIIKDNGEVVAADRTILVEHVTNQMPGQILTKDVQNWLSTAEHGHYLRLGFNRLVVLDDDQLVESKVEQYDCNRRLTDAQVRRLHPGDQVTWNDPDEGTCSKTITIKTISVRDGTNPMVTISDAEGDDLQCYARELS